MLFLKFFLLVQVFRVCNFSKVPTCEDVECEPNETCKYYDSNMYRCPSEKIDCTPFKNKLAKIPYCVSNKYKDSCSDQVKIGNGVTYRERFYFDIIDKVCKKFYFTGFNGNLNNFPNEHICNLTCIKPNEKRRILKPTTLKQSAQTSKITTKSQATIPSTLNTITTKNTTSGEISFTLETKSAKTVPYPHMKKINGSCQWICNLDCQFGYKIDYKTNCYKCDCIEMKLSECGVPCWNEGTKGCLNPNRANSRPLCVCNEEFTGSYCEAYNRVYNFSVELDKEISLNNTIQIEIENNMIAKLSDLFETNPENIQVNNVTNCASNNTVFINFSVRAQHYTNIAKFSWIIDDLYTMLIQTKNLTIDIYNQTYVLLQKCNTDTEVFLIELDQEFSLLQAKSSIEHLKKIIENYEFLNESLTYIKLRLEPTLQIEFMIQNHYQQDENFCNKTINLKNDIRHKVINLNMINPSLAFQLQRSINEVKRKMNDSLSNWIDWLDLNETEQLEEVSQKASVNLNDHLITPSFLKHTIVFVSLIVGSFFILIFLISLIIISRIKKSQKKKTLNSESVETTQKTDSPNLPSYFMASYDDSNQNDNREIFYNYKLITE